MQTESRTFRLARVKSRDRAESLLISASVTSKKLELKRLRLETKDKVERCRRQSRSMRDSRWGKKLSDSPLLEKQVISNLAVESVGNSRVCETPRERNDGIADIDRLRHERRVLIDQRKRLVAICDTAKRRSATMTLYLIGSFESTVTRNYTIFCTIASYTL